jgi:hypothetical protein
VSRMLACASGVLLLTSSLVAEVTFTAKPTVTKSGEQFAVNFAVSAPTDVEVAVLDAKGKVVRHLAAGVLGPSAPAPLKPNSLAQSLAWDGKDDLGSGVWGSGSSLRIRVRIGMKPEFDGFLLFNPSATGTISALAVGPQGHVYLFHRDATANGNMGGDKLKVIDRDGRARRTLIPMNAALPVERLKPLGVFQTEEGRVVPRLHNYEQLSFYPDPLNERGRSMPEFSSPAVDASGRVYWLMFGARLACLDRDGGVPYPTFYSDPLLPTVKGLRINARYGFAVDRPSLAVSGDGKWLYISGLQRGGEQPRVSRPVPAVFRVNLETRAPAEVFLGDPDEPDTNPHTLGAPRGLAVANGLLYVADFTRNQVVAFKESDRSIAGRVAVSKPDTIGVDPASGAIYVLSQTGLITADLIKFDGLSGGKEKYRLVLPRAGGNPWDSEHRIAVDASGTSEGKPVAIWLPSLGYTKHNLIRILDLGDQFGQPEDPRPKDPYAEGPRDMNVDRQRGLLYVKANLERWYRVDESTGSLVDTLEPGRPVLGGAANGTQLVPAPDGSLYTWSWNAGFFRFDHDGKPLNWVGRQTNAIPLGGIMCFQERHMAVLSPEELLIVLNPQWFYEKYPKVQPTSLLFPDGFTPPAGKVDPRISSLGVIGTDGRLRRTVIWQCMAGATPRLDARGNIYLAEMVKPAGRSYPEFFDGKLEPPPKESRVGGDRYWTSYVYGSIIKFAPTGGAVWYRPDLPPGVLGQPSPELLGRPKVKVSVHMGYQTQADAELQGAEWFRFGFAPYSCWSTTSTDTCMCEGSRFDVDPYGRVFFPNLGQFRVEVIDTNNNHITTFGCYGNEDFEAKTRDGIPFAWPTAVAAGDSHVYVGDTLNRRVVRVKLAHTAEATCDLK